MISKPIIRLEREGDITAMTPAMSICPPLTCLTSPPPPTITPPMVCPPL